MQIFAQILCQDGGNAANRVGQVRLLGDRCDNHRNGILLSSFWRAIEKCKKACGFVLWRFRLLRI